MGYHVKSQDRDWRTGNNSTYTYQRRDTAFYFRFYRTELQVQNAMFEKLPAYLAGLSLSQCGSDNESSPVVNVLSSYKGKDNKDLR